MSTRNYFRAELLRAKWSFTMFLPVIMVAIALVSMAFSSGVNATAMASAHFYSLVLLPPLGALTAVIGQSREEKIRHGGLSWRNISPRRVLLARVGTVILAAAIGHALMAALLADSFENALQFTLFSTLSFFVFWAFGLVVWRLVPRAALLLAPLVAIAWGIAGTLSAMSPSWLFLPWTWAIRPTLPIHGVLPNSVAAPAGSEIWSIDILPPALLHAFLGIIFFAIVLFSHGMTFRLSIGQERRNTSFGHGLAATLPWRTWWGLAALMCAGLAGVRAVWDAEYALGLLSFVCVPTAATVVAIMTWTAQAEAWPALMYRRRRLSLTLRLFALDMVFLIPVLIVAAIISGAGGKSGAGDAANTDNQLVINPWPYQALVSIFVAAMIVAIIGLTARRSVAAAIFVSVALGGWAVMIGGDVLSATPLWWTSEWGWTWVVRDYPERWPIMVLVSTAITGVFVAWARATSLKATRR
ncbi:MAG: hypothetical protein Q4E11_09925 [Corynebacterium sp.]|uniref:hypothetical protein n=1 Tax=Corynebacterium sp. TaxID=1720 RepID=UPI0026DD463A|nr:hypothetical protein [Corynebacterium sp.]MDO5030878.1 hypothetical protein [Corynebacterium sp.]